ncbi:hypothetical protein ACHAXM_005440 [Skeletonema potamos]
MEDDEDFEELFSFAAASPHPTEKTSPSTTSSEFDMINNYCDDSATGDNARTTSCSALMPSTPGSTSDFDDIFGTPPPREASATAKATKLDEDPETSFLGTDALDDFQVHDEGTRDFLDWLDDDAGKKDPPKSLGNEIASKDTDDVGGVADDDDFDFDKMLSEVGIDDTKPAASSTAATPESMTDKRKVTVAQKEVIQVKQTLPPQQQQQQQQNQNEPKYEKSAPPTSKMPPSQYADSFPAESEADVVMDCDTTPPAKSVAKVIDDNDVVMGSREEVKGDTAAVVMTDTPNNSELTTISSGNETDQTSAADHTLPLAIPSVEDELSYQQWNDDVDVDNADITDVNEIPEGNAERHVLTVKKKPVFSSLSEAIRSNSSTMDDVRLLFGREIGTDGTRIMSSEDRAYLWAKVICGKSLEDVDNSSLADSFREWQTNTNIADDSDGESVSMFDAFLEKASSIDNANKVYETTREQLLSLLNFHRHGKGSSAKTDALLPPVAYAILRTGMPLAVASVVLSQIEPKAMPLMRLSNEERFLAAKALHAEFYLLACYHLPLLMMHLDRNCQDWYWPKKEEGNSVEEEGPDDKDATSNDHETKGDGAESVKENAKSKRGNNGLIPQSWFVTNFAGECEEVCLDHTHLLPLWDHILTTGDSSWKFFLAISVLEKRSDVLLMLTGEELRKELEEVFHFNETPVDSFVGSSDGSGDHMVSEWLSMSKSLIECTPSSVIELLRSADDRAIANALKLRQIQMERELQAQADAHEVALKKVRDERNAEEKKAEIKARLTAYYRTHNSEKLDTIDEILKLFDGRIEVLNDKLKNKYGSGFLPDGAPINQVSNQTKNFFMSVNQSINDTKKHVAASVKERRKKSVRDDTNLKSHVSVALEVSPTEVIPHVCSKKQAGGDRNTRLSKTDGTLNFYLIDCRPESIAREQGRFPKAINMSPEKLQDPEELQRLIDMFESLRGAVHICVMGEGFASFPVLYNHPLTKEEQKLLEDDISRTSSCALFFLKKGFPFVSLLRGGFAAAHAFLSRSGPPGLSPTEVLIDYDPDTSLFAQLETSRQEQERFKSASNREKTARAVQRIIDNSMTRLTLAEMRINSSAAGLSSPENVDKVKKSVSGLTKQIPSVSFGRTPPLFMSKKLAPADEGSGKQKSVTPHDDKKDKPTLSEKMNFRLPSLKSDTSSQRDLSEADVDSLSVAPAATEQGESQETANKGTFKTQPSISTTFSSFAQRMQQNAKNGGEAAPPIDDSSKVIETSESKLPKIQLEVAKNSLSSFANRIKAADSKGKVAVATSSSTKDEGPSNMAASFSSFAAKLKTSAASTASKAAGDSEKTASTEATSSSTKEEGPSNIAASFSIFAAKLKPSAAATASTSIDDSEQDSTSSISISFSSFANKMKSSTTNVTGKAADTEGSVDKKSSNPFSSFALKKTTTPDWMTPTADKNSSEESASVSEKLGWLMRDDPPGKSFSKAKPDQNQKTEPSKVTEDESLVFDVVEEEVNFG